jgi:hypothetical protein
VPLNEQLQVPPVDARLIGFFQIGEVAFDVARFHELEASLQLPFPPFDQMVRENPSLLPQEPVEQPVLGKATPETWQRAPPRLPRLRGPSFDGRYQLRPFLGQVKPSRKRFRRDRRAGDEVVVRASQKIRHVELEDRSFLPFTVAIRFFLKEKICIINDTV